MPILTPTVPSGITVGLVEQEKTGVIVTVEKRFTEIPDQQESDIVSLLIP